MKFTLSVVLLAGTALASYTGPRHARHHARQSQAGGDAESPVLVVGTNSTSHSEHQNDNVVASGNTIVDSANKESTINVYGGGGNDEINLGGASSNATAAAVVEAIKSLTMKCAVDMSQGLTCVWV